MKRGPTGLPAWMVQRASAVLVLLFLLYVLGSLWRTPVHSHADWVQWLARPGMRVAIGVFFAALLAHMWVGLRDVLLDYSRPVRLRPYWLMALAVALGGLALWAGAIVLRLPA